MNKLSIMEVSIQLLNMRLIEESLMLGDLQMDEMRRNVNEKSGSI